MTLGEMMRANDVIDAKAEAEYDLRKRLEEKANRK